MPRVRTASGVRHFPYTAAGYRAAAKARRGTGRTTPISIPGPKVNSTSEISAKPRRPKDPPRPGGGPTHDFGNLPPQKGGPPKPGGGPTKSPRKGGPPKPGGGPTRRGRR